MLTLGASIHEGLGDDGQRSVHHFGHVDVKDEVWILEDVHPESQREAAIVRGRGEGTTNHGYYSHHSYRMWKNLAIISVNPFKSGKHFM